jgi:hypothetical protein
VRHPPTGASPPGPPSDMSSALPGQAGPRTQGAAYEERRARRPLLTARILQCHTLFRGMAVIVVMRLFAVALPLLLLAVVMAVRELAVVVLVGVPGGLVFPLA